MKRSMYIIAAGVVLAAAPAAMAQFSVNWHAIAGGGSVTTGGGFRLTATIGQSTSGAAASIGVGGSTSVSSGFLAGFTGCLSDFNGDCAVSSQDFFDFLNAFFTGNPAADLNRDQSVGSQDFFDYLAAFFNGC